MSNAFYKIHIVQTKSVRVKIYEHAKLLLNNNRWKEQWNDDKLIAARSFLWNNFNSFWCLNKFSNGNNKNVFAVDEVIFHLLATIPTSKVANGTECISFKIDEGIRGILRPMRFLHAIFSINQRGNKVRYEPVTQNMHVMGNIIQFTEYSPLCSIAILETMMDILLINK